MKAAAETFRPNPDLDTKQVIMELGVGEALVSTLEKKGQPSVVQRTLVRPPSSRLGPIEPDERKAIIKNSPLIGLYDKVIDRESAHEILKKRAQEVEERRVASAGTLGGRRDTEFERHGEFKVPTTRRGSRPRRKPSSRGRQTATEAFTKSLLRRLGSAIGGMIVGVLTGKRRRR